MKRSWQLLLVALALLIAQGPVALHLLLVPHTTCAHGELIEAQAAPAQPPARAAQAADGPQIDRGHTDASSHEHCDALAVRHQIPEVTACIPAASLAWIMPAEVWGERAEVRPVAPLSLAPKASPPC